MDKDINYQDKQKDVDRDDYEDNPFEPERSPEDRFYSALIMDDSTTFVAMINDGFTSSELNHPQDILLAACRNEALRCASALIKGETCLTVDINSPYDKKESALHYAAKMCQPSVTEFLLVNNALTGVRLKDHRCFTLPLHLALESIEISRLNKWLPEHSINRLLFSLCIPQMQKALETIGLLAWTTRHTEKEFLRYVEIGKVVEVAALLMVAWKKLRGSAITARSMLTQNEVLVSRDMKTSMLQLFEIFESAGDDLVAYVKLPKLFVCNRRTTYAVKYLLQRNGIHVDHEETDLSYLESFHWSRGYEGTDFFFEKEICMEHYGRSGYRWIYRPRLWEADTFLRGAFSSPNIENTNFPTIDRATTLNSESATDPSVEALNKVKGWRFNMWNVVSSKSWVRKLLK